MAYPLFQKLDVEPLLNEKDAATILVTTKDTLKQARNTGILFGKPAPRFIKMGRSARYRLSTLLEFRDQFPEYENTLQYPRNDSIAISGTTAPSSSGHEMPSDAPEK